MIKDLKKGSIIKGSNWPEPIEIKFIEEDRDYIHIIGATITSKKYFEQIIPGEEFSKFSILGSGATFSEEPWKIFLAIETTRYRFASMYDPLLAMNTSKIDPLPHQIEAVYGHVLKLPRIRFLIADDPGAGKTIMAGLIIKELKLRNLLKRVLIVVPGHLKDQWRRELKERFEEKFMVFNREFLDSLYGENAWMRENQIITSIDFIKKDDVLPSISASQFDLTIIDEAHKMSAYHYGNKTEKTSRYKLGEVLSQRSEHLLFLTATPHKGDPENFRLFLDLLEPGFFATKEMIAESIKSKDNQLFIRRIKEDLKDFEGKPLFLSRYITTPNFELDIKEKELYNKLSKYVEKQYNKALNKDKKRSVAFALVILQRRLASSTYALCKSLERRKKRLQDLLDGALEKNKAPKTTVDFEDIEDLDEENRWEEERIWETLSVAENREELKDEIMVVTNLIEQAEKIIQNEEEIKLRQLKKSLNELTAKYIEQNDKKVIIFTESKDTLEYLEEKIRNWGYVVNTIHGGMRLEERIMAEEIFKNQTQILVATEAAGEGINLQFCHLMINYDLPWNPNRLEQRMGRIHRYGQQKDVHIFNLVAKDTREGKVLYKLFEKLEKIKQAMGSDKVFDVLGEVLHNVNLSQLLMEAAVNAKGWDENLAGMDIEVDEDYIAKVKEDLGESLATRIIDFTRIKEIQQQAREYKLIPEYTENFFKKAFTRFGGRIRERKDGFLTVDFIPYEIREIAEQDAFKRSYGGLLKRYPKVTFDKEIAFKNPDVEFISFGHVLFEAVMTLVENKYLGAFLNGAIFIDPEGRMDGHILFYEAEIKDGLLNVAGKRLFAFYVQEDKAEPISPAIIWDLAEGKNQKSELIDIDYLKKVVSGKITQKLEEYKEELYKERLRQAEIKEKYGLRSLDYLILQLDDDLISLDDRQKRGENVDLAIRNKEERKKEYEKTLEELKEKIEKEKSLTMSNPHFIGIIWVSPKTSLDRDMRNSSHIEQIGMRVAMEHERKNKRLPEDVSLENLGFDIRSKDKEGNIRYIEVKARAETGAVALTQNEWFKAQRFKDDYYLYAVMNAAEKPQLYIIRNPAENLEPEEKVEVVRYVMPFKEIVEKGVK
ncbi:MAG: helicase-related protein [bacterium]|nr:helicase-related protein [bacterium]